MAMHMISNLANEAASPIVISAAAAGLVSLLFVRSFLMMLDGVPGPFPWPLVGQIIDVMPYVVKSRLDKYFYDKCRKYGPIYRITLDRTIVVVSDPVEVKRILSTPSEFVRGDTLQRASIDIAPSALFVLPTSDQWKKHRKLLQPAFGPQQLRLALRLSVKSVDEATSAILGDIEKSIDGKSAEIDIYHIFHLMTLDLIGKVAFSHNFSCVASYANGIENKDFKKFESLFSTMMSRVFIRKQMWPMVSAHETEPKLVEAKSYLRNIIQDIINKRRAVKVTSAAAGTAASKAAESNWRWEMDVLDRLLDQDDNGDDRFTEQEIIDELVGFFLAGHETTANTMTFMIYSLVQNPEAMKRLVAEIDEVYARLGGNITTENIHEFRYLDWTMKESLRQHPVVTGLGRESIKPVEVLGHQFPSNTLFIIEIESLHRDPRYWKDPEGFNPDRWADTIVPGSFMPFGDGPHVCVGQKMAQIEARIMVLNLLRKFSFEMVPNQKLEKVISLTAGFKNGFRVRATVRAAV